MDDGPDRAGTGMTGDSQEFFAHRLSGAPVMVIARGLGPERTVAVARRAWRLGVSLVEVPVQSEPDLQALTDAVNAGRAEHRPVGAGTVTSIELVRQVADAGAVFTVAPGLDAAVAEASTERGLPHLPGVATPTDVHRALQLGLTWQKAFPASVLGSEWIAAMRGPFPQVHFVATGGIDVTNSPAFLHAGAAAVSLGSSFESADDEAVRGLVARA